MRRLGRQSQADREKGHDLAAVRGSVRHEVGLMVAVYTTSG